MVKFLANNIIAIVVIAILVFLHIVFLVPLYWAKENRWLYWIALLLFGFDSCLLTYFVAKKIFNWDFNPVSQHGPNNYGNPKELFINLLFTIFWFLLWGGLFVLSTTIFDNFSYYK